MPTHLPCDLFRPRGFHSLATAAVSLFLASVAVAGGAPETTLVIVNANSPLSQRIANAYVRLRDIPASNVLWLPDVPAASRIDITAFRERVWKPIRRFIRSHGLDKSLDTIVYSSQFPYAVDFSQDLKANNRKRSKLQGDTASLTGLTFFARKVENGDLSYLGMNRYFRESAGPSSPPKNSVAFSSRAQGEVAGPGARRAAEQALRSGDFSVAVERFRALTRVAPEGTRAWYDLARAFAAAGEPEQAVNSLSEAIQRGWTESLRARRDPHLRTLMKYPPFETLLRQLDGAHGPIQLPHGFRGRYDWRFSDLGVFHPNPSEDRYYLSVMLAYTGRGGNSVPEVLRYLASAASSDGAHPEGTVYFLHSPDVRSVTRQPLFATTLRELAKRGRRGEVLVSGKDGQRGNIPFGKNDVIGAVVGARRFDWGVSKSRFLPGAIAESLTSYGGHFDHPAQTKLTEFLRHGAAGSSGAVSEPFALQGKFPVPLVHVYYAEGCSLAESFYQSVSMPYQLIVVGDPLARPFAYFADVAIASPDPRFPWNGDVILLPKVDAGPGRPVERVELWVDGQYVGEANSGVPIAWDTRRVTDGTHELRLVAVEAGRIETRSYKKYLVKVDNGHRTVSADQPEYTVRFGDTVQLSGRSEQATRVEVFHGHRSLGLATVEGGLWRHEFPSEQLGIGTVSLHARADYADGPGARSAPLEVVVLEPVLQAASPEALPGDTGLRASVHYADGAIRRLIVKSLSGRLAELKERAAQIRRIDLDGQFFVPVSGFYELNVRANGELSVDVGQSKSVGKPAPASGGKSALMAGLGLEQGWHGIRARLEVDGPPFLEAYLAGEAVAQRLAAERLRHHAIEDAQL